VRHHLNSFTKTVRIARGVIHTTTVVDEERGGRSGGVYKKVKRAKGAYRKALREGTPEQIRATSERLKKVCKEFEIWKRKRSDDIWKEEL